MMDRRHFLQALAPAALAALPLSLSGCRNVQHAHVLDGDDKDMVGSHTAGAETWKPLIDESVGRLLGRQISEIQSVQQTGYDAPHTKKHICFVGVENKSSEEIGDFKEQIYQHIDTLINQSEVFEPINRRYVEAGLQQCGLRPDQLFIANNQRMFAASMEQFSQPFDYLLYATITSGTTHSNHDYQRDYLLTLELVDIHNGHTDKESADIRKGYHKSPLGRIKQYGARPFFGDS
jgi:hypothetical protein